MNKLSCNVGDKFGNWTVIEPNCGSKNGHTYVKCQCACGTYRDINLTALVRGRTQQCRTCYERSKTPKLKIGSHIKHWTILDGPIYKNHHAYYKVRCDCGKETIKLAHEVVSPNSNFQCLSCAQKENKVEFTLKNGRIGDLNLTQYTKLRKSANKRNIEFNISIEYLWDLFIKQKQVCAITGDYIDNIKTASLDRIDSSKGYIKGNVQWVTYRANVSKHTMTMPELFEFCRKVLSHANQQPSQPLTKLEGSETRC